mmetsp:Transcript_13203/g.40747  ORF Transcript_13203/g.40747 Transcript_13203/m.40747 type:complete len:252 (+) Transcript_13203:1059-1814(+)
MSSRSSRAFPGAALCRPKRRLPRPRRPSQLPPRRKGPRPPPRPRSRGAESSSKENSVCKAHYKLTLPLSHMNSEFTTAFTDNFLRCVYFCPTPMNMMGWPVLYVMESVAPTLSSIVSNFVSTSPSIWRPSGQNCDRLLLNMLSWSMPSLPTSASPTKSTRSGELTVTSFASSRISLSLFCMRPAVSMRTQSRFCVRACASDARATSAGSFKYPFSKSSTSRHRACDRSCSTAPDRNVSHAVIMTSTPCSLR